MPNSIFENFYKNVRHLAFLLALAFSLSACSEPAPSTNPKQEPNALSNTTSESTKSAENKAVPAFPKAVIRTSMGEMELELYPDLAPLTVANFIQYANNGFYEGTVFHRVIPDFMIQGGGFDASLSRKETAAPIKNEAGPALPNLRGTIAMARTADPHSATSQFFINVKSNDFLNKSAGNPGYAVFGKLTKGLDVADKISLVQTGVQQGMADVPNEPVTILSVSIID